MSVTRPGTDHAAGEAPGEVAPHRGSVNELIIVARHDERAAGVRALCNAAGARLHGQHHDDIATREGGWSPARVERWWCETLVGLLLA